MWNILSVNNLLELYRLHSVSMPDSLIMPSRSGIWTSYPWRSNSIFPLSCRRQEMQFGSLHWDVTKLSKSADFLDLTIDIEKDGSIVTKTHVKPMNLHLYIPPDSAHPAGVLKSLVFGNLQRYRIQNTHRKDYVSASAAFYGHLLKRGWSRDMLNPVFQQAAAAVDLKFTMQLTAEEPL